MERDGGDARARRGGHGSGVGDVRRAEARGHRLPVAARRGDNCGHHPVRVPLTPNRSKTVNYVHCQESESLLIGELVARVHVAVQEPSLAFPRGHERRVWSHICNLEAQRTLAPG